jgi:hypothetical protein
VSATGVCLCRQIANPNSKRTKRHKGCEEDNKRGGKGGGDERGCDMRAGGRPRQHNPLLPIAPLPSHPPFLPHSPLSPSPVLLQRYHNPTRSLAHSLTTSLPHCYCTALHYTTLHHCTDELAEGDRDGRGRRGQVCHHQPLRDGPLDREGE